MNKFIALAATAAALATAPVAAATYSAFGSFNGVNGNGGFSYGYTGGSTLNVFDVSATSGCALNGPTTCLYASSQGNLPQASVGGTYPTVSVPTDAILVHPGNAANLGVYSAFSAVTAGNYSFTIDLQSVGRDTTNGTTYQTFTSLGGIVTLGAISGTLPTYLSTASITGFQTLAAGESFGVIVGYNGNYGGDSTGLNFTISNVPEPATWGLMIAGFAMVGVSARRRRTSFAA